MRKDVVLVLLGLALAYAVGWVSEAALNDHPCIEAQAQERDRVEYVERWLPVRTDCRVTSPSGVSRVEQGGSETFLVMFGLTLLVAGALASHRPRSTRAAIVVIDTACRAPEVGRRRAKCPPPCRSAALHVLHVRAARRQTKEAA
jgi:hypothetical protein